MTTVAFDGRTMAGDGRLADDAIASDDFRKIFRIRGQIVGLSGAASACMAMVDWMKGGCEGKRPECSNTSILIVEPDGTAMIQDDGGTPLKVSVPCAIGSGSNYAVAIMDAGGSATKAVRAAMKRDPRTGGKIRTLRL